MVGRRRPPLSDPVRSNVPPVDSAWNDYLADVVGNKNDTAAGTSLVSLVRGSVADTTAIQATLAAIQAQLVVMQAQLAAIQAVTNLIPDAGAMLDLALIRAVTDLLPNGGALTSIAQQATLTDVQDEVEEIDQHVHNVERWWGSNGAATETNAIAATVTVPFVAVSGNNTWGVAIPICGTADNPVLTGQTEFDAHRVMFTDLDDDTSLWRFRIIWGTGTSAAAIAAGQWSEVPVITTAVPGNRAGGVASDARMPLVAVGTKLWGQSWNDTNAEALSFIWGAHGYPYPP